VVCECVRVVTELAKFRLGSVEVQEVSWEKGGTAQCFCVWREEQKASAREVNYCTLQEQKASAREVNYCTLQEQKASAREVNYCTLQEQKASAREVNYCTLQE